MIDSTHILVTNWEFMFILIGKVIQYISQDIKPADFDHFLKSLRIYNQHYFMDYWTYERRKKETVLGTLCGMQYMWCSSTWKDCSL